MNEIREFSNAYYMTTMTVAPYKHGPVVEQQFHDKLEKQYYSQTNAPVMFRLGLNGQPYFVADTEYSIPEDHMGVPREWFADNRMEEQYGEMDVFILKPTQSYLLNQCRLLSDGFKSEEIQRRLLGDLDE